jgi:hypothetical protein
VSAQNIQQRLAHLEAQLAELLTAVRARGEARRDWRRTIGALTDDPGMQAILKEAMKQREADRRKTGPGKRSQRY